MLFRSMTILCPASHDELREMLRWAVRDCGGPVAVRYPRGTEGAYQGCAFNGQRDGVCVHREGRDVTLITYGNLINNTLAAADALAERGISAKVLRLLSASHIPDLAPMLSGPAVVIEEAASGSGIREALACELMQLGADCRIWGCDLGREFVTHGDKKKLYKNCGLDPESLAAFAKEVG